MDNEKLSKTMEEAIRLASMTKKEIEKNLKYEFYKKDNKNNRISELKKCTRVVIIDGDKGRIYDETDENNKIYISLQDDGKTLKVFINKKD